MNQKSRKRYTPEFKAQAVELLTTGKPVPEVAEELCISGRVGGVDMGVATGFLDKPQDLLMAFR